MLKKQLKNIKLKSKILKFYKKNKDILLDIFIFGSFIKGKEKPNDIDILILYKDKKNFERGYELKKILREFNAEITNASYSELFNESFKPKEGILSEGYSVINKKFFSEGFGYTSFILFKYELKGFNKSNRMRFYYSLHGRGKDDKGIIDDLNLIKFSDTILFCPVKNAEKVKEYFDYWKIKYLEFPILIPTRLNNLFNK
ncbi:MAG: nucleotidyltransferase domain-containing protein [Nanoarchaeota archaeon]